MCLKMRFFSDFFSVHSLQWHNSGKALLLVGKDQMCVCFLTDEPQSAKECESDEKHDSDNEKS